MGTNNDLFFRIPLFYLSKCSLSGFEASGAGVEFFNNDVIQLQVELFGIQDFDDGKPAGEHK